MSGIVGIVNTNGEPIKRDLLGRLTDFIAYRGPDAQSIWIEGHVGFGHTMLRTTDESARERQPFSLDGEIWITADARVDGRSELRRKLRDGGAHIGADLADVELILHAYRLWGVDCVDYLLGDFVFAIWDRKKRRLFCARDHFGVKPFFYACVGNALVFGNTLNCLRIHPDVSDDLNEVAIGDFLLFAMNQDPATTTFADIQRLPGGHCLVWSGEGFQLRRYWSLSVDGNIRYKRSDEYVDHFNEILRTAVDDRVRMNRVAVEMSGGLDSPAIAATAKEILASRGSHCGLRAYTWVYDRLIPDRERHFSRLAAEFLEIPIDYLVADDYALFESGADRGVCEPEPFYVYPQATGSADFCRMAASGTRVLLTGWDGDALMSESPRHYFRSLLEQGRCWQLVADFAWFVGVERTLPPVGLRTWLKRKLGKYPGRSVFPTWVEPAFASRIDLRARWEQMNAEPRPTHPMRPLASTKIFLANWWALFERYDPGLTGFALEARHPFVDRRLVDYVLAIPPVPWSIRKHILRAAMAKRLPEAVLHRPKSPLAGDPVIRVLREADSRWLDDFEPSSILSRFVVRSAIPRIADQADSHALWLNLYPYLLNRWVGNSMKFARDQAPRGCADEGQSQIVAVPPGLVVQDSR